MSSKELSPKSHVIDITSEKQFDELKNENKFIILLKTAPAWCGPCQQIDPVYEELAEKSANEIVFTKVDVSDESPDWLDDHFRQGGVPQFHFYLYGTQQL